MTAAPAWLRALAPPEWHTRYDHWVEETRLPEAGAKREAYVLQVGADGYRLLDALSDVAAPPTAAALPAIAVLQRVRVRHFERWNGTDGEADLVRLRDARRRGPGDRVESPYDIDARFRAKSGTNWTGYMVHLTETCDPGLPRLLVHTDTTPTNVHEAVRTGAIHEALSEAGMTPSEHLVDAAYVSAEQLVAASGTARDRLGRPGAVQSQLAAAQ